MIQRNWYRRPLQAAITVAALMAAVPTANAQAPQSRSQMSERMDDAVKVVGNMPRMKGMSDAEKRQLVEFVTGNTMFVMAHEMGHGLINEFNMPVLGREEDAADSFAIVTGLK